MSPPHIRSRCSPQGRIYGGGGGRGDSAALLPLPAYSDIAASAANALFRLFFSSLFPSRAALGCNGTLATDGGPVLLLAAVSSMLCGWDE